LRLFRDAIRAMLLFLNRRHYKAMKAGRIRTYTYRECCSRWVHLRILFAGPGVENHAVEKYL